MEVSQRGGSLVFRVAAFRAKGLQGLGLGLRVFKGLNRCF